jgi:hypothetical protein
MKLKSNWDAGTQYIPFYPNCKKQPPTNKQSFNQKVKPEADKKAEALTKTVTVLSFNHFDFQRT